ncbi:MAG: hypothetical protein HC897_11140 [Thermoanaerobaculia bacterium]|nr:hypothetical protein [Thermoanaerobaculia bacterium]
MHKATGDIVVMPTSEAEVVAVLAAAHALGIPRPSIYHLIAKSPRLRTAVDLRQDELEEARRRFGDDLAAMADALEVSETALRRRLGKLGLG